MQLSRSNFKLRIVAQEAADLEQVGRLDDHEGIDGVEFLGLDAAAELLLRGRR